MTYAKYGAEFSDDCVNAGLSDAAYRTHSEAISWIYRIERDDLRVVKTVIRRFAGSSVWESAVQELIARGYWMDDGDAYVIVHHGGVIRQSLVAQRKKRERDRRAQGAYRERRVSADVSADVSDVADRQSDKQALDGRGENPTQNGGPVDWPKTFTIPGSD